MRFAETGFNLEVDLTRGNIERVESDPSWTEQHIGGLGTNARIMYERVTPDIKAFDPENLLIFGTGLLCGTPAPGANRTILTTISPQTDLLAYSMMGGFFAPELKYAGYDKIIFRGKSPKLVYLWIHNDKVELRDAEHLRGMGSMETAEAIKKELKEPKAHVAAIGMAGENRVFFASIEQGRSSASRLGIGGVMGDKGLKAVVVRGSRDLNVAKPQDMFERCQRVLNYIQFREENPVKGVHAIAECLGSPQEMRIIDEKWHTTSFVWGNARTRRKDFWTPEIEEKWAGTQRKANKRQISCYNCPMKCGAVISMDGQANYMMKCFTKLTYTMAAFSDLDFGFRIAQKATEYGVDGYSAPQVMAFALELKEAGILEDHWFEGMPEDNEGKFYWLLDRIVRREGIGDILADGTHWAAEKIGKGAMAFAHNNIKKHEQVPLKLGMLNPVYFLMYATGEKNCITQIEGQFPQSPFDDLELRQEFVKDWHQVPDEKFKDYLMGWNTRGENSNPYYPTVEMSCDIVDWQERMHYIDDAVGVCAGLSSFPLKPPYHMHSYPGIISAATGLEMDEEKLTTIARRNRTLVRAFNNRRGMTRADDVPPENHWKKRFPELEKELLEAYYKFRGFNENGIPTKETLVNFGLDFVAEDLIERGILQDTAEAVAAE